MYVETGTLLFVNSKVYSYMCITLLCIDIDECISGGSPCGIYSNCTNTPGSYTCDCIAGYHKNGTRYCTGKVYSHLLTIVMYIIFYRY